MKNKIGWGIAGVIVVIAGFALLHVPSPSTAPTTSYLDATTTEQTNGSQSQPTFNIGTPTVKPILKTAAFDQSSLISTSTYPTISGTSNATKVIIVISDTHDVGIVGAADIPVIDGHWSYSCSVALQPAMYKVSVYAGQHVVQDSLTILKNPSDLFDFSI